MADKEISREIVDKVCEAIEVARTTGKIRKGANEATKAIEKGQVKFSPINNGPQEIQHKVLKDDLKGWQTIKDYIKAIYIDIRFPQEITLSKIKPIIKQVQKDYFQQNPDEKPIFNKEMIDGRADSYSFVIYFVS